MEALPLVSPDISHSESKDKVSPSEPLGSASPLYAKSASPLSRAITTSDDSIIFTKPCSLQSTDTSASSNIRSRHINSQENHNNTSHNELPQLQDTQPNISNHTLHEPPESQLLPQLITPASEKSHTLGPFPVENEENETSIEESYPQGLSTFTLKEENQDSTFHENASYIQDEASDDVLLNNYVRRRRSTKTDPITQTEPYNPKPSGQNRDSILTNTSKPASVDAATIEIERMRNSILSKREKKKQQRQQQNKSTASADDESVLVGKKVSEGHVNYMIAYNMLTGIRVAVSRCSGIIHPLTDTDFSSSKKLVFDISGNELTPSSKYDFKFKDYSPNVFRELRLIFGLDPADYLVSLTSKYILSELTSPGKSGSFFYFSRDYRFIIKTIHPAEHRQLRKILKDYYEHVKENPNTLISQFYGLHRVKMPLYYGSKRKIYFIVMNNLFPPHKDIHSTYDLKGSLLSRLTIPKENKHVVFKDLNWIEEKKVIKFGPQKMDVFLTQLKKDVKLLIKLNIMDYSLLVGFHDIDIGNDDVELLRRKLSVFSPPSSKIEDLRSTNPRTLDRDNLPGNSASLTNFFYTDEGGIFATDENDEPINQIYYFGIIDCLTNYSIIKRLETFWKSLTNDRKVISALPPNEYGDRFLKFIEDSLNENTIQQGKDKNV